MMRRAMTLVEMMVATTATLILMGAVAQVFSVFGSALSGSRSVVELDGRIRTIAFRLRSDLAGATARPLPPLDPQSGEGYFEIIEGPANDFTDLTTGSPVAITSGMTPVCSTDCDDVLLFTTRNSEKPFMGRADANGFVEGSTAEVAWFARKTPGTSNPVTYTLFRRQLLVLGVPGFGVFQTGATGNNTVTDTLSSFYEKYDISVRPPIVSGTLFPTGSIVLTPNTLTDLTRRECRFLHYGATTFPFPFVAHQTVTAPDGLIFAATSPRVGEDVVLTNVLAFDVRVFDPAAPVHVSQDAAVVPGDPGMGAAVAAGAYVDLGNNNNSNAVLSPVGITPHFSGYGASLSKLNGSATAARVYDTWSTHYEADGIDQDDGGGGLIDEGSDGFDNNDDGQVDEFSEQETSAPYPYPLRGIEVRIRCWEPSSRQVRQVTVRHTFVPH